MRDRMRLVAVVRPQKYDARRTVHVTLGGLDDLAALVASLREGASVTLFDGCELLSWLDVTAEMQDAAANMAQREAA